MASLSPSLIEAKLGVRFRNPLLLQEALTHTSYYNENPGSAVGPNERLEFLGDAILDYLVAEFLFTRYPDMAEGEMTALRAALVKTGSLAKYAKAWDLGDFLFLGKGEEAGGGRNRVANLCAGFEAMIGAIYLDQGLEMVRKLLEPILERDVDHLVEPSPVEAPEESFLVKDAKSKLQELAQSLYHLTPSYKTVGEQGPDHLKEFTVEVNIGGLPRGRGAGRSKQAAEQEAAREALAALLAEQDECERVCP